MVQKVTGFKTEDGKVFDTEALAVAHEKFLSLGAAVKVVLVGLGFGTAVVYPDAPHDDGTLFLEEFLLNNSEVLVEALTPPKKERKPRAPRAPVDDSKPLTEALTTIAAGPVVVANVLEASQTTLVADASDIEAGNAAEDELAALLGGEVASTTEVAV